MRFSIKSIRDIETGDVVVFSRKRIHALIREAGDYSDDATDADRHPRYIDIVWLDGYDICFRTKNIKRTTLIEMAKQDKIHLFTSGIENKETFNYPLTAGHPARYSRDTTVQPGRRMPVSALSFERTYSLNRINGFLKHPLIDHTHGRVAKAKAMFVARRPDNQIAAVVTVNSPNARGAFDRKTVEITRYASHPGTTTQNRTNNTASWMLSRVCDWAALEGYTLVRSLAGTDGNDGNIYKAANFTHDGDANSSGSYGRDGRRDQSHDQTLTRYVRHVTADGQDASDGLAHRFESRIEANDATTGNATILSQFRSASRNPTPAEFRLTREDASDTKFTSADGAGDYPLFSDALATLVTSTNDSLSLDSYHNSRGRDTPAAVFGAAVGDRLVAAAIVSGNPKSDHPTARVEAYTARPTKYPQQTAQWLLTRVRNWAELETYQSITVPPGTFDHVDNVAETVPQGVGWAEQRGTHHYASGSEETSLDASEPSPDRQVVTD